MKCTTCSLDKPDSEFRVKNRFTCNECRSTYHKQWRLKNAEKKSVADKAYRHANRERINAQKLVYKRKWRADNAERCREADRRWAAANRDSRRESGRKWSASNPRKRAARKARYYQNNKDRVLERQSEYYQRTKAARRETNKRWLLANPEAESSYARRRKARKLNSEGRHTRQEILALWDKQQQVCAVPDCKNPISGTRGRNHFHVDHIQPLSRGGSDGIENIQILCGPHNFQKSFQDPVKWAQRTIGRLFA